MSKQKYIQNTLTLPAELPLFNYNINFDGLRKILDGVSVKTNSNQEAIRKLQELTQTKLPTLTLQQTEKKLNSSFLFGTYTQNYIDQQEQKLLKVQQTNVKEMPEIDQFCWKMNRMAQIVEYLFVKTGNHQEKIGTDNKRTQKLVDESFNRLSDKLNASTESFSKTINTYFTQSNQKVSELQSSINTIKLNTESKINDLTNDMNKKVSDNNLKAVLESLQQKIKKQLQGVLKNDQMQRLTTVNQIKNSLKEAQKDLQLKNKAMNSKLLEMVEKVNKALQISNFQIEKHKIYQRLSQLKNRSDELYRKNNEFVDFRKAYLSNNQKTKQQIIGLNEQIKKINQKQTSFKKIQNMSDVLNSLNPHLICQLGQQVKLHQKQIGKLEKQFIDLENQLKSKAQDKPKIEVNGGQNADLIQKMIKQFMSNLDFEGRAKRTQKDIQQLKKKNDSFAELEKKIYILSKEVDMGAIMKELHKKCDQENTRKDIKILDGKIEQLFEFYKQLRRQISEGKKPVLKNDSFENASLTTKKLVSANCLSCNPSTPSTRRNYSRNKLQMSLDYGVQSQKNTIYSRMNK